jgi:MYXO-CTERM domain-containing protein
MGTTSVMSAFACLTHASNRSRGSLAAAGWRRSGAPLGAVAATLLAVLLPGGFAHAADCFVDSVGGADTNNGASETAAWQSLSKIASSCTTVKFKRGSEFNLTAGSANYAVKLMGTQIKVLTNYGDTSQPLPKFIKPHQAGSGAVFSSYTQITIDGLYMSGSRSDAAMSNLADGICLMIGGGSAAAPSEIKNCEITLCDIGMMTSGDYVRVHDNYVHDLSISVDAAPGVDPNAVGGAEGIFVNSSHVRVDHNRFVNCSTAAQWVSNTNGGGVRCDGGATEVTVPNGKNGAAGVVTDVEIDHNFSYNSCGFFEVSSMFQSGTTYVKGQFTNSTFHDNVMVDSGWISLLQVNNTKLINVRWENNTIVHHDMGTALAADGTTTINLNDFGSSGIQAIAFNSTSSGVTGGGEISAGDIYWTNNLWYFDTKVKPYNLIDVTHRGSDALLANITVTGDIVVTSDPGFKDITSRSDPAAYDLVASSSAIDKGVTDESVTKYVTTDFMGRSRPAGAAYDLGAFEYGSTSTTGAGGTTATGTGGAGGTATAVTGKGGATGTTSTATGTGGAAGGATTAAGATGGVASGSGGSTSAGAGGSVGTGGASVSTSGKGGAGGASVTSSSGTGGASVTSSGGGSGAAGATGSGGSSTGTTTTQGTGTSGCTCHVGQSPNGSGMWLGLFGFALLALRRRRRRC